MGNGFTVCSQSKEILNQPRPASGQTHRAAAKGRSIWGGSGCCHFQIMRMGNHIEGSCLSGWGKQDTRRVFGRRAGRL